MHPTSFELRKGDALFIVDVQKDFCPGGRLPIENGTAVIPVLNRWIKEAWAKSIPIFASRDWHPREHISFDTAGGPWPAHCVQDTQGAEFHADLALPEEIIVITKGVRFDKDQNSAFDETGIQSHLKKSGIQRLIIGGLAQDVCVKATVLDALAEGFDVVVLRGGTRPVTPEDGLTALQEMKQAGAQMLEEPLSPAGDVCQSAPEFAEHARANDIEEPCDDGRAG